MEALNVWQGTCIGGTAVAAGNAHYALGCWRMCPTPDKVSAKDKASVYNTALVKDHLRGLIAKALGK